MSGTDDSDKMNRHSLADLLKAVAAPPTTLRGGLDSLTPPPRGTINSLLDRPEVNGLYYNGKELTLDGYTFIGCRFDNCTLRLSTSNFNLIRCIVDDSTTIIYGTSALKVIQLFNSRYPWAYEHLKGFVPTLNPDGTITISDRAG
jgi:hypothetical protein